MKSRKIETWRRHSWVKVARGAARTARSSQIRFLSLRILEAPMLVFMLVSSLLDRKMKNVINSMAGQFNAGQGTKRKTSMIAIT
jgi:hypothetical protein